MELSVLEIQCTPYSHNFFIQFWLVFHQFDIAHWRLGWRESWQNLLSRTKVISQLSLIRSPNNYIKYNCHVRRSKVEQEEHKLYWKSEKGPYSSITRLTSLFTIKRTGLEVTSPNKMLTSQTVSSEALVKNFFIP